MILLSLVVSALWTTGATSIFSMGTRVVQEDLVGGSGWVILALAMYIVGVIAWSKYIEGLRA